MAVRTDSRARAEGTASTRAVVHAVDARPPGGFDDGVDIAQLLRLRTTTVDEMVLDCWSRHIPDAGCALFATGGYGRGELFPFSDVDLLVLVPDIESAPAAAIGDFIAALWDAGLKPGHAVRDLDGCREAAADLTVVTSLMDARLLSGDPHARPALAAAIAAPLWPADEYLAARQRSQQERHARFNDTAWNLEPNVKDGPGGLRDFHTLVWVSQRLADASGPGAAVRAGLLSETESVALEAAVAHVSKVRFALHQLAGRAEERLLFDHQRELARAFGFDDEHAANLAVEQFMQAWFRAAQTIDRLNERVLARCSERNRASVGESRVEILDAKWQLIDGALSALVAQSVELTPPHLIEAFAWLARRGDISGFHSTLIERLDESLERHQGRFHDDVGTGPAFMALLRQGGDVARAIAAMGRHGVMAQVIPAFGRVTGRMQYDLFHVYTVDQHTLFVVRNLLRFAQRDTALTSLGHTLWRRQPKPELVLLAGLFHDIAKGRGGDHSELGEVELRSAAPRLGLSAADTEFVAWLVRQHLLMSTTAQKQDITDPDVVHRFAAEVADTERLDALYLLTVADIQGTSPRLWNAWKAQLLEDLHAATRHALRRGLAHPLRASERVADIRLEALRLLADTSVAAVDALSMWESLPDYAVLRLGAERLAWATGELFAQRGQHVQIVARAVGDDAIDLIVHAPDRDGLFATVTAVLDRQGFDVVEARATGTRDGRVLDLFRLLPRAELTHHAEQATTVMLQVLREALSLRVLDVQPAQRRLSRQQRHFRVPLRAEFRDLENPPRTQLALVCADRPGLLARIAASFREHGLRVHDARIATFGERAEDFFELTDSEGGVLDDAQRERLLATLRGRLEDRDA